MSLEAPSVQSIESETTANGSPLSVRDVFLGLVSDRQDSLTEPEASFLELVAECGSKREIALAQSKLLDESLFAAPTLQPNVKTTTAEVDAATTTATNSTSGSCEQRTQVEGSVRRQERLDDRKENDSTHTRMWQARESGMALSTCASRRSLAEMSRRMKGANGKSNCRSKRASISTLASTHAPSEVYVKFDILSQCSSMRDSVASIDDSVISNNTKRGFRVSGTGLGLLPTRRDYSRQSSIESLRSSGKRRDYSRQSSIESLLSSNTGASSRSNSIQGSTRGSIRSGTRGSVRGGINKASRRSSFQNGIADVGIKIPVNTRRSICLKEPSMAIAEYGTLAEHGLMDSDDDFFGSDIESDGEDSVDDPSEKKDDKDALTASTQSCNSSRISHRLSKLVSRDPLKTRRASVDAYGGEGFEVGDFSSASLASLCRRVAYEDACADDIDCRSVRSDGDEYDPWAIVGDNDATNGIKFDFCILGTSASDMSAKPHVLSPPIMESLQPHLPFSKQGESFWLKYSMVRDGASAQTFLQKVRGAKYTLLAMETLDGEVFGAFTGETWHTTYGYFGTGETFVWKMKNSRSKRCTSVVEQAEKESDIEVFRNSYQNRCMQICKQDRIAVGGGAPASSIPREIQTSDGRVMIKPSDWGFALAFEGDSLLEATTSPCVTFNSPSLSKLHSDGSRFELLNVEAWTLTPCISEEEAELMECSQLFLKRHGTV